MEQTITVQEQRRVLNSFLAEADDEKVQQMFQFFTTELLNDERVEAAQMAEVSRRREAFLRGEMESSPWREVMARLSDRMGNTK